MDNVSLALKANEEITRQFPQVSLPPVSLGPLPPDELAVALGLKQSSNPNYTYPRDELERLNKIVYAKHTNGRFPQSQQEIVWSRFCALYLAATVDKFLDPPAVPEEWRKEMLVNNAYFEMLSPIQHSPYFYKYLRSTKPIAANNMVLTKALTERFLDLAPEWDGYFLKNPPGRPDRYFNETGAAILQLLATLLTAFIKYKDQEAILPSSMRKQLTPWLTKWSRRHRGEFLGEVANRVLGILSGDKDFNKGVRMVRRMMKGWEECGMEKCKKTENLKTCARCQTVRYCCPEHQKAHWSLAGGGHKEHCFKTDY